MLLWLLTIGFLRPYYRAVREDELMSIVFQIEEILHSNTDVAQASLNIAYNHNVCFAIYSGDNIVALPLRDGIGVGCYFHNPFNVGEFIEEIRVSEAGEVIRYLYETEMLLFGTRVNLPLTDLYLIINSRISPEDSILIIQNLLIFLSFVVVVVAAGISLIISRGMAAPIVKMTNSAKELASGNFNVEFPIYNSSYAEMNELANTLNYATNELSKMDELRRDLIANVSHDIKTPLTMIKAYAEMINDFSGEDKQKRKEHLEVIITEVNHLDRLVVDMLELSQVQSGVLALNIEKIDLVQCTKNILKLFQAKIKEQKIELIINVPAVVYVEADEVKIGQVIYNYVNNALKYVGDDKQLLVSIEIIDKNVRLSVEDHGIGISEENIPFIWDRYYKIDKNFQRNLDGTGLGLAISKGLLIAHNAKFGVNSTLGQGSIFWFELPISKK